MSVLKHPIFATFHGRNSLFVLAMATQVSVAGSILTAYIATSTLAGFYMLLKHRKRILLRSDLWLVIPGLIYLIVMWGSYIRHDFEMNDLDNWYKPYIFIGLALVLINYRLVKGVDYFTMFIKFAGYSGYFVLPWILYQGVWLGERMSGGSGNPIPFAMVCGIMAPLALLGVFGAARKHQIIAIGGALLLFTALVLSQTRGMYIAFAINILIVMAYAISVSMYKMRVFGIFVVVLAMCAGITATSDPITQRVGSLGVLVLNLSAGEAPVDSSFFQRQQLYNRAICLIKEKPMIGFGYGKRDDILAQGASDVIAKGGVVCPVEHHQYTHFHNGYLSATVDAGIFGLFAILLLLFSPWMFVLKSPKDEKRNIRLAFASIFVLTYAIMGMFNILFGNDLIDSLFIMGSVFLALSVVKTDGYTLEAPDKHGLPI